MNTKIYIAHIRNGKEYQLLEEHLNGTSKLASQFASKFHYGDWGRLLGLWHDIGKYSESFQQYIRQKSGLIEEEEIFGKVDHSSSGAIYAKEVLGKFGIPLAYCIAGHHTGLLNWNNEIGLSGNMIDRLQKESLNNIRTNIKEKVASIESQLTIHKPFKEEEIHVWIRMLYSCLVDADYLDTERFMSPETFEKRGHFTSIKLLKEQFDTYMSSLKISATPSFINKQREEILIACRQSALLDKSFFVLTVPTGGGKTLSSLAFALEHAHRLHKDRIIVAIPYTSIVTQTVHIFKEIFGKQNVIEHHSNLDEDVLSSEQKLATENWDAPIIVTTNVQLFESLFSCRSSHCRKLHNLANSILILDEAQMLPSEYLKPITSILNTLINQFNVTLLCTTATQPLLTGEIGSRKDLFTGITSTPISIIPNPNSLSNKFQRVEIELPNPINKIMTFDLLAKELQNFSQVLCIVNTRKECQDLYSKMPEDTFHLSRMMCSAHILDTIKLIKGHLAQHKPIRVISTQLIEAGVDIDFPVVYRSFAGLESIIQAAGRCNREGNLNKKGKLGKVKVFNTEKEIPLGYMRKGADTLKRMIAKDNKIDILSPTLMNLYFDELYKYLTIFDKADIKNKLYKDEREMQFQFATAAKDFKLIEDQGSQDFVVNYGNGANYIKLLKEKGPETWLLRKLQHYSVSVRLQDFNELKKYGYIESYWGIWIQADNKLYNSNSGVIFNNHWLNEVLIK